MPKRTDIHKVLIIGSGPIVIGQACEFDYSGTQACKALRKLGYEIVLVNSNPATIMTDPETADVTYIEPLNAQRLEEIIAKERPDALLPNLGGQSGLNLCAELAGQRRTGGLRDGAVQVVENDKVISGSVHFGEFHMHTSPFGCADRAENRLRIFENRIAQSVLRCKLYAAFCIFFGKNHA